MIYKNYTIESCKEQGRKALWQVTNSDGKVIFFADFSRECKNFINAKLREEKK